MIEVDILKFEDYNPSTVTVAGYLNTTIDIVNVSEYLPVNHIFDAETGERVKLKSGSRQSISYYGVEGVFISICYKKMKRGMRTGAMNNMVSLDIQYGGKNVHLKLSKDSITSVGTKTIEIGKEVFNLAIDHIIQLQEMIDFLRSVDTEKMNKYIDWFIDNTYDDERGLIRESEFLEILDNSKLKRKAKKVMRCFGKYINDFDYDEQPELIEKINNLLKLEKIYTKSPSGKGDLECQDVTIYNSVYHITPIKIKRGKREAKFRMPLHELAPFLYRHGLMVEYHNWSSEGVTVCMNVMEEKKGSNHVNKEYKHRFVIHETSKIRQCSPTCKEEAYGNYLGLMRMIQQFLNCDHVPFEEFICTKDDKKLEKMLDKLDLN